MRLTPTTTRPVYCNASDHWPVIEVHCTDTTRGWRGLRTDGASDVVASMCHLPNAPLLTGDPETEATWLIEEPLVDDPALALKPSGCLRLAVYDFVRGSSDLTGHEFHITPVSASRLVLTISRETIYALDAEGRGGDIESEVMFSRMETPSSVAAHLVEAQQQLAARGDTHVHTRVMPDLDAVVSEGHLALTKALHQFAGGNDGAVPPAPRHG